MLIHSELTKAAGWFFEVTKWPSTLPGRNFVIFILRATHKYEENKTYLEQKLILDTKTYITLMIIEHYQGDSY
jgi:hypothetical protein